LEVTVERIGDCRVTLTLKPEPERVQKALRRTARELSRRMRIPGFRPGKAPYRVVEQMVGRDSLLGEVLDEIGEELYEEALKETGLEPYSRASLEIAQKDPLTLKVTVDVVPEVDLGDYRTIRVESEPEPVVEEEEVIRALEEIREERAEWVPVERPAQMGDQVVIDVEGTLGEETIFSEYGYEYLLTPEDTPPGFSENLVGMQAEETREFSVVYPDDFHDENLRSKEVNFRVVLVAVREKVLPALDDDLAKEVGDYATLDELRDATREKLLQEKREAARDRLEKKLVDALLERAKIVYPASALEDEIEGMLGEERRYAERQGFTMEGYLNLLGKTEAQLREELLPRAEERLKRELVLNRLAKEEGITVGDEELVTEMNRIVNSYGEQADVVRELFYDLRVLAALRSSLSQRKAMERLIEIATGRESQDDSAMTAEDPSQQVKTAEENPSGKEGDKAKQADSLEEGE